MEFTSRINNKVKKMKRRYGYYTCTREGHKMSPKYYCKSLIISYPSMYFYTDMRDSVNIIMERLLFYKSREHIIRKSSRGYYIVWKHFKYKFSFKYLTNEIKYLHKVHNEYVNAVNGDMSHPLKDFKPQCISSAVRNTTRASDRISSIFEHSAHACSYFYLLNEYKLSQFTPEWQRYMRSFVNFMISFCDNKINSSDDEATIEMYVKFKTILQESLKK